MKITNKMIYDEIVETKEQVLKTNGRVSVNRWMASSALGLSIGLGSILLVNKLW